MAIVLLRFVINLKDHRDTGFFGGNGPLFHRWLPNGEKDAIMLETGDENVELKIWFERLGYLDGSFIKFDKMRHEVEPEIMDKQGMLEAGPLQGSLKIGGIADQELQSMRKFKLGVEKYKVFGKKVIKLIYPSVSTFIDILRTNYGQYWIPPLGKWDSTEQSIGSYCLHLHLTWSLDEGKSWLDFNPDKPIGELRTTLTLGPMPKFQEYLTREDWQELAGVIGSSYQPDLVARLTAHVHRLLDEGNIKYALIEGVTALEVTIEDFVRRKLGKDDILSGPTNRFLDLPLPSQIVALGSALTDTIPIENIEGTVSAIISRNSVVHDGEEPTGDAEKYIRGLLNTLAALLPGPRLKFPESPSGNVSSPPEKWEQRY